MTTLFLAYAAGLLTLVNPCVLPVLPLVLASALQRGALGPLMLAAGMGSAFTLAGLGLRALTQALGLSPDAVAQAGAAALVAFGAVLLVPAANRRFALATAGLAGRADAGVGPVDRGGAWGQFLGGALLGAVWSPCVGPTLGGALALAAQGQGLLQAGAVMAAFAAGTGTVILALGYGARGLLARNRGALHRLAEISKPVTGLAFLAVGLALLLGLDRLAEGWLVAHLPAWLQDLSVSI